MDLKMVKILCLSLLFLIGSMLPAFSQENIIRAKIGIQVKSGERSVRAKSRDRLRAGDLIRIYVHPERSSSVYVIHSDGKTATLLNLVQQKIQSSTLVMPSIQEFYQVDGASPKEAFTIICSPRELSEALELFDSGEAPHSKWAELEGKLIEKGRVDLSQKSERPFSIAGNVRGVGGAAGPDPFISKLQIFSGKSILVKKYEFRVKK